eukprot:1496326-Prymnesium_polylepis.3
MWLLNVDVVFAALLWWAVGCSVGRWRWWPQRTLAAKRQTEPTCNDNAKSQIRPRASGPAGRLRTVERHWDVGLARGEALWGVLGAGGGVNAAPRGRGMQPKAGAYY